MSVATKNPFALLEAEDASRPTSPTPAKKDAPAPAPTRGAAKSRGPASRGGRYYQRGGKPSGNPNQDAAAEEAPVGGENTKRKFDGEGRGRGRGRGRGDRGDRRGAGGGGGRGRPFDRHSQTGKTDSDKKIHQSWGGDDGDTELKAEEAGTTDAIAEGPVATNDWAGAGAAADTWGEAPAIEGETPAAPEGEKSSDVRRGRDRDIREPEEEDNTLTYDQYLAQLKEKEDAAPKVEARQANEGADDALWKDAVQHKKNEEEDAYFVGKTRAAPKARAKKEEKVFIEIDARFERPSRGGGRGRGGSERGRGGDGGRGGERGRGGRGRGGRPPRANGSSAVVDVADEAAFPSLS